MIERLLEDEEGIVDRRVAPSLLALLHDQAALIDPSKSDRDGEPGLRNGFVDRREIIMWYQRAGVRTLGHISENWDPIDCVDDDTLIAAMVRFSFGDVKPMGREQSERYRQIIETDYVIPACNAAFRELKKHAADYVRQPGADSDSGDVRRRGDKNLDPSKQAHVAMRPGFQTVDRQQRLALEEFWGGFEDVGELEDWILGLNSPSRGEIGADLAEKTINDDVALKYLVNPEDTYEARRYQDLYVGTMVLPKFVDAVKKIDTDELAKATSDSPQTLRMKGDNQ